MGELTRGDLTRGDLPSRSCGADRTIVVGSYRVRPAAGGDRWDVVAADGHVVGHVDLSDGAMHVYDPVHGRAFEQAVLAVLRAGLPTASESDQRCSSTHASIVSHQS
jgi:hypothetical protein